MSVRWDGRIFPVTREFVKAHEEHAENQRSLRSSHKIERELFYGHVLLPAAALSAATWFFTSGVTQT